MSVISAGSASAVTPAAGGGGAIQVTGACGDILRMRVKVPGDPITLTFTIPSTDPSEVWTMTATQQDYGPVTGGRIGNPVSLIPSPLPQVAFSPVEGGFSTTGAVPNTAGLTHGFSYTATRTSPTPLTCSNQGFWTNPGGTTVGPVAANPVNRPDTAPALTGTTEADAGTNDALLQFDQEMLATGLGLPAANRFAVTVDGVARTVTGVAILNDSPPFQAAVDLTFSGAALTSGQTVAVRYNQPVINTQASLQDLESLRTASFGPVSISVF